MKNVDKLLVILISLFVAIFALCGMLVLTIIEALSA